MRPDDRRTDSRIGRIVLAAGASTRLGRPKQLLLWRGRTLLRYAAETAFAAEAGGPTVVVLGAQAERMRAELDGLPVTVVVNPEWEEGMASSLRAGLAALLEGQPEVDAVLMMLCDQPLVTPSLLDKLIAAFGGGAAVDAAVCEYGDGVDGPPCVLRRTLFPAVQSLTGAQGAKRVWARLPPERIGRVSFPGGSMDIDTEAAWEQLARL